MAQQGAPPAHEGASQASAPAASHGAAAAPRKAKKPVAEEDVHYDYESILTRWTSERASGQSEDALGASGDRWASSSDRNLLVRTGSLIEAGTAYRRYLAAKEILGPSLVTQLKKTFIRADAAKRGVLDLRSAAGVIRDTFKVKLTDHELRPLYESVDTDRTGLECEEFIVMIGDAWDEKKATLKKDWLKAGSDTHNDAHGAAGAGPETSRRRKHKKRLVYQGGDRKDGDPPPPPPLPHAGGTSSPFSCDFMVLCAPEAPDAPLGPEEVG